MLLESLTKHPSLSTVDHISNSISCGRWDGQLSPAFKSIRLKAFNGGWKFDRGTTKLHARILRGKGVQKKKPNMCTVSYQCIYTYPTTHKYKITTVYLSRMFTTFQLVVQALCWGLASQGAATEQLLRSSRCWIGSWATTLICWRLCVIFQKGNPLLDLLGKSVEICFYFGGRDSLRLLLVYCFLKRQRSRNNHGCFHKKVVKSPLTNGGNWDRVINPRFAKWQSFKTSLFHGPHVAHRCVSTSEKRTNQGVLEGGTVQSNSRFFDFKKIQRQMADSIFIIWSTFWPTQTTMHSSYSAK